MLGIAAAAALGLWIEWEVIRSAVRRALLESKGDAQGAQDPRERVGCILAIVFIAAAVAIFGLS